MRTKAGGKRMFRCALLPLTLFLPITVYACTGYVFGFKGLNNQFDIEAFNVYVKRTGYCSKTYDWNQVNDAIQAIRLLEVPHQLYGFSKGAETISTLLKMKLKKPEYVLTIGAYKTVDVNFDKYNVRYKNYFDDSGRGQQSPGIFLNVPHMMMQKEVNKLMSV
jgi:hypothetical protein